MAVRLWNILYTGHLEAISLSCVTIETFIDLRSFALSLHLKGKTRKKLSENRVLRRKSRLKLQKNQQAGEQFVTGSFIICSIRQIFY
jgi:hypothetical protein